MARALEAIAEEKASAKRINDKLLLAIAERTGLPVLTYGKQLQKQARRKGLRVL